MILGLESSRYAGDTETGLLLVMVFLLSFCMQVCDSLSMRPFILHSIPKVYSSIHPSVFKIQLRDLPRLLCKTALFSKSLHCRCTMSLLMLMHFWILTGTAWRALKNRALLRWTQMLQVSLNWNALHASLHILYWGLCEMHSTMSNAQFRHQTAGQESRRSVGNKFCLPVGYKGIRLACFFVVLVLFFLLYGHSATFDGLAFVPFVSICAFVLGEVRLLHFAKH